MADLEKKTKKQLLSVIDELKEELNSSESLRYKQIAGELTKKEIFLKDAQKNAGIGSWDWNILTNEIYWSDEMFSIMEIDPEQGIPSYELSLSKVHPDDREFNESSLKMAIEGKSSYDIENRLQLSGQSVRYMHSKGAVEFDDVNRPVRMFGTVQDITARKHLELKLRQSEKLQAIGLLASGIAHDFNNQLAVVTLFSELAKKEAIGNSKLEMYIENIRSGAMHSSELVNNLLNFAQNNNGGYDFKNIDVNAMLSKITPILRYAISNSIEISESFDTGPSTVNGDSSLLQNAIVNMALNSRDAMPDGGELNLSTERVELDEKCIEENAFNIKPGGYLRFTMKDSGKAMSAEVQNRMFDPFFTTKEKGNGLGMASVYGTVKNHCGAIDVVSIKGQGTSVSIFLPVIQIPGKES